MMVALGRHLADSTIFALVIWVLCLCMRRHGPAARHTLWLLAVAKFVLPIALFSLLGERLRGLFPAAHVPTDVATVLARWVTSPVISAPSNSAAASSFYPLVLIWLTGSAVALALWLPKLWTWRGSSECPGESENTLFLRLKKRIGQQRNVQLRFSDAVPEPALAGFWRPVVLIPAELIQHLSPAELESVILHELAHAKRWDNWMAAFAHAVSCLFWFYPLLWWIEKRLGSERERACDEMVIRCGAVPEDYTAGILKVCRLRLREDVAGISAVSGSNLKNRMERIMSLSSEKPSLRTPKVLVGSLIAAIVGIPLMMGLFTVANARATHAKADQLKSQKTITCTSAGVGYAEGTVIQMGNGPEQVCVRSVDESEFRRTGKTVYGPEWVPTSKAIRERSATVVHVPDGPLVYCSPGPAAEYGRCTCQAEGEFSSGAQVNSAKSPFRLQCENGNWVQTKTPNVKRN